MFFSGNLGQPAVQTGNYAKKYNLIHGNPSCLYPIPSNICCVNIRTPQCPLIYNGPGDIDTMSIHPNIKERTEYLMRNMARLFSIFYSSSEYGFNGRPYALNCNKPNILPINPFYFISNKYKVQH